MEVKKPQADHFVAGLGSRILQLLDVSKEKREGRAGGVNGLGFQARKLLYKCGCRQRRVRVQRYVVMYGSDHTVAKYFLEYSSPPGFKGRESCRPPTFMPYQGQLLPC